MVNEPFVEFATGRENADRTVFFDLKSTHIGKERVRHCPVPPLINFLHEASPGRGAHVFEHGDKDDEFGGIYVEKHPDYPPARGVRCPTPDTEEGVTNGGGYPATPRMALDVLSEVVVSLWVGHVNVDGHVDAGKYGADARPDQANRASFGRPGHVADAFVGRGKAGDATFMEDDAEGA